MSAVNKNCKINTKDRELLYEFLRSVNMYYSVKKEINRYLSLLVAVFLLTGTLFTPMVLSAGEDSKFDRFANWSLDGDGQLYFCEGITGNAAQISKNGGGETVFSSDAVKIKENGKYNVGISVRTETKDSASVIFAVQGMKNSSETAGEPAVIDTLSSQSPDFVKLTGDYEVPDGVSFIKLIVIAGDGNSASGDMYILDNAFIYEYSEAAVIFDSINSDGYKEGDWFRYPDGNGVSWTNNEFRYAQTVDEGCRDKGALYIHNTSPSGDIWLSVHAQAEAGREYTVSLMVKGSVTYAAQSFRFVDRGNIDNPAYDITKEKTVFDDWTEFTYDYVSGGGNEFFIVFSQYNNISDIYIDNITVTDKASGEDILEGRGSFINTSGNNLITANNLAPNGDFEDLIYTYLPLSEFNGSFEGARTEDRLDWSLETENGDGIMISHDDSGAFLEITKGSAEDTVVSFPSAAVEGGRSYRLSFDIKGSGDAPEYKISGYYSMTDGTGSGITVNTDYAKAEADWQTGRELIISGIPENAGSLRLYITFRGNAGDRLCIDNVAVNPMQKTPSLEKWTETGYSDPDMPGISDIELSADGSRDTGSVHFVQNYAGNTGHKTIGISNMLTALTAGKAYIFKADIKGSTKNDPVADPLNLELYWNKGTWSSSGNSILRISGDYADWTTVSYEFTCNMTDWAPLFIGAGGYSGVDCYIDNVSVTEKGGDGTNLLLNGGFASDTEAPDIAVNLIPAGDFEDISVLTVPGWSISGSAFYDESAGISLNASGELLSYRYNTAGGDIYNIAYAGDGAAVYVEFDVGAAYSLSGSSGYFAVPEGAAYMRVRVLANGNDAIVKSITLTKNENPENFDFELKDFDSERPLNWTGYTVSGSQSIYTFRHTADKGENGSGGLLINVTEKNGTLGVAYSKRIKAKPNYVYSVSFSGNYKGKGIVVSPYVRTYNSFGNDTVESSSYNWLNSAKSENNDGEWHGYYSTFTTGSDTAFIEMRFEVKGPDTDAEFIFDNLIITELGSSDNKNFDFETGNDNQLPFNWTVYERREKEDAPGEFEEGSFGAFTVIKANGAGGDGSAAAAVRKNTQGDTDLYFVSSVFELSPDTNYTLSYEAMTRGTKKGAVWVCLRQYKDNQLTNVSAESEAFFWLTNAYATGSYDWREFGTDFKTSKETKYAVIWFVFKGTEQFESFIDNISIVPTEEITDVNLDFEYTAAGKPVNWEYVTSSGICSITADRDIYYRGKASLYIEKRYSEINYTTVKMKRAIAVNGGDDIEFAVHINSRNAVSGNFAAYIIYYDRNGNEIQTCVGQDQPLNSDPQLSGWHTYRINFPAPQNASEVRLLLRIGGRQADVYLDSIEYYNYTANGNTVYAEDFAGPSSSGSFGGWRNSVISGNPVFETQERAGISGDDNDKGAIETDIDIIKTDYVYEVTAVYRTSGTARGRLVIDAYDWRDIKTRTFVSQDIENVASAAETKVTFTADSSVYYRLRFEKTGGSGTVYLQRISIAQTGEPATGNSWEGKWIVHPDDYNSIETNLHNERNYFFRQEFSLDSDVKTAQMQLTADDKCAVYINGQLVFEETRTGDTWDLPTTLDIAEYLHKGKNVLAVRMYNNIYAYGMLYDGIIKMENDTSLRFYSDTNVLVARESYGEDNTPDPEWTEYDRLNFMNPDYDTSACAAWTAAMVYTEVGGGSWGTIDFDNSEYSEYKLTTNEFDFPDIPVYAGDTVDVTAKLTISEKMPDTGSFAVHFWKKNSTRRICSGTLSIASGESAADWPAGREFTAKFTLKIPEFLSAGNYTVQFDSNVAIVSDYYINNKVGNISVVQVERTVDTTSEIRMYNGKPVYFVNGIATAPLWFSRPERDSTYRQETLAGFAGAGIDTNIAFILPNATLGELWLSDGSIETETIDQQMLGTLSANPEAKLLIAIDTTPPQWWLDANPEECVKLSNGTVSKNSFSSEKWKEDTGEIIIKIVEYIMSQPYANNIVGFKITGGTTFEWQWWGMNTDNVNVGDFSSVGLNAFRNWLRKKYVTDAALKEAWNDSSVTFDTVQVPSVEERSETEYGSVLSVQNSRKVIDYELFMGDTKADAAIYFARLLKEAVNDRLIVGTYAGYLLNCWNYEFATTTGQTAAQKILDSEYIDFIACPWNYGEREIGYSVDFMSLADSVSAHGKLYVAEDDDRNNAYLSFAQDSRASVGWTRTVEQAIEQLKRNYSYALSKGHGLYFYDLGGTYYVEEQFYKMASQMMQEMTLSLGLERESVSEIAVFVDEQSIANFPYTGSDVTNELLFKTLMKKQRDELYNTGAPFDLYLLDDLEKGLVPEHRINIMLSASQVTASERRAIEDKLKKNGNIIVWQFINGISDGETTCAGNISDLIGMNVEIVPNPGTERKLIGTVNVTDYSHWLTSGLSDVSFGAIEYRTLSPVIAVNDSAATVLGEHSPEAGYPDSLAGLAVKSIVEDDGDSWISVYSAVPGIPSDILRNILKYAEAFIYDDSASDIIYADSNYISVHSLFGGEKTVRLPERSSVYDVFNRKMISYDTDEFVFTANGPETRLFRVGRPGEILIYVTSTTGGTVSPQGLKAVKAGDSFEFSFAAEDGYRLNYLLVDGERISSGESSYRITDINESHTAVAYFTRVYDRVPVTDEDDGPENGAGGGNGSAGGNGSGGSAPDSTPDGEDVTEPTAIVNKDIIYYTSTSLNWPVIAAAIAGVLLTAAIIVWVTVMAVRRTDADFYRGGRRLGGVKVRKGIIKADRLDKKHGTEGVTVCVKSGYVKKHNFDRVTVYLGNSPLKSATLRGFDDFGIYL